MAVDRFEQWRFRQNNVKVDKSIEVGVENEGNLVKIGADSIVSLTPDDSEGAGVNIIPVGATVVNVGAVVNDANDFIVLPALASVPNGTQIKLIVNAGANCELRTPASSGEEINSEDCDGTKELLMTDTNIVYCTKINNTIGWMSNAFTAIGAVVTAVVPD
jgi:hypothetical protein